MFMHSSAPRIAHEPSRLNTAARIAFRLFATATAVPAAPARFSRIWF